MSQEKVCPSSCSSCSSAHLSLQRRHLIHQVRRTSISPVQPFCVHLHACFLALRSNQVDRQARLQQPTLHQEHHAPSLLSRLRLRPQLRKGTPLALLTLRSTRLLRSTICPTTGKPSPPMCMSLCLFLIYSHPDDLERSDDWCHLCMPWYGPNARRRV